MLDKNTNFLIVGLGLIGGSYAKGLKLKGYKVYGLDLSEESINYAIKNSIIDDGFVSLEPNIAKKIDVVIICLYPSKELEWIRNNQYLFNTNTLFMDVSGVKAGVVEPIQNILRSDLEFISTHPMAGREVSGVQNANNEIFAQANYIIVPTDKNSEKAKNIAKKIGEELNFRRISTLNITKHDEIIGFVSQLTHIIAISLMTCNENENLQDYTGDSFRDLTRIARINENMWYELFIENKEELLRQIDSFINQMNNVREMISSNDEKKLKDTMIKSTKRRALFDKK